MAPSGIPIGPGEGRPRRGKREDYERADERRAAVRASQRMRILAGAASCAREAGVVEVTVAAIVTASRVSRRTFYEQFENTEDCMLATFEQGVQRAAARMLPAYEAQSSWRAAVRAGLSELLAYLEEEPTFGGFCVVDAPGAGRAVLRRRAELLAALAGAVEQGRAAASTEAGLPASTGEMIVAGAMGLLHARLLADEHAEVGELLGELMAALVRPYLGPVAAEEELILAAESRHRRSSGRRGASGEPRVRWTYRTIAVVKAVAERPGSSNRAIGEAAGVGDPGQISKLLSRLQRVGLIENEGGATAAAGTANAWYLTERGQEVVAQLWGRGQRGGR